MFAEQVGQAGQSLLVVSHGRFVVDAFLRSTLKLLVLGQLSVNDRRTIGQLLRDRRGRALSRLAELRVPTSTIAPTRSPQHERYGFRCSSNREVIGVSRCESCDDKWYRL